MKLNSLLFGSATAMLVVTGAQAADLPTAAEPVEYVRVCDAYGAGFFYIPGSETCLRVGGRVRIDAVWIDNQGRLADDYATRARAYVRLDARTQTDIGLLLPTSASVTRSASADTLRSPATSPTRPTSTRFS